MRKYLKVSLLISIIIMISFIWSNSLKSPNESVKQSGEVAKVIETIITHNGQKQLSGFGSWIIENVRKIAHFVEFFSLAVLITTYIALFYSEKKFNYSYVSLVIIVAIIDEIIQIFTNRGAMVIDVLIDSAGGLLGFIFVVFIKCILYIIKNKRKNYE